jgi:hypothetical protein
MANNNDKVVLEKVKHFTDDEIEVIADVYDKYYRWRNIHFATFDEFGGKTLKQYVDEARDKFYGKIPISTSYELTGRKLYFSQEYRVAVEKVITFITNLALNPQFYGIEGFDVQLSSLLNGLYRFLYRATKDKIRNFLQFWQAVIDGTVIVYTDARYKTRKYKDITYFDPQTYEIKYKEKEDKIFDKEERIVNLDDFFFPKIYEPDIQKQEEVIERVYMKWTEFKRKFGQYPNAQYVYPGIRLSPESLIAKLMDKTMLMQDKVEILRYYNRAKDEFVVIANGIWINPVKEGRRLVRSPLPWNHKELPFAYTVYKPISNNFFYGASIVHQIKSPVEAIENLIEMSLERIWKAINPPIVTADPTVPESNFSLEGGKIYSFPMADTFREIQMNPLDPSVWNMNVFLQGTLEKITTPLTPPATPTRQPKSAAENLLRQQAIQQSFSLPKIFYQDLLEQKARLQIKNLLQFMTSIDMQKAVGERKFRNVIRVNEVPSPTGVTNLEIRVTENKESLSTPEALRQEKLLRAISNKENIEIIEVSAEMLKNLDFDIAIKFDLEQTPQVQKALFMEFAQLLLQMFPDIIDRRKAAVRLFEIWNESPGDWLQEGVFEYLLSGTPLQPQLPQQGVQPFTEMLTRAGGESVAQGVQGGRPGYGSRRRKTTFADLTDLLNVGETI